MEKRFQQKYANQIIQRNDMCTQATDKNRIRQEKATN